MDYYEILGVSRTASLEDVNDTYRKLAMEHHPDANIDNPKPAAERFKKIALAYETISDPNKRARYNRDHPPKKKPKPKPKPKSKTQEEDEGPKFGVDYKTGRAPTHDIWGNPLSAEERKQWEIEAAAEAMDFLSEKGSMNNPEAVKKWAETRKKKRPLPSRDPNDFYDAFAREYESGGPKHVR